MKEDLREAIQVSMLHLPLILLIAALLSLIWIEHVPVPALVPAVIMAFVLTIVLYGRLAESVLAVERSHWWDLFKSNVFNFLLVGILLAIPSWAAMRLAKMIDAPAYLIFFSEYGIDALISAATVYVTPIIFMKGFGPTAVPLGIAFLMSRLQESVYLVGLTLLMAVLPVTSVLLGRITTQAIYMSGLMLLSTWLGAIIFSAATRKLSPGGTAEMTGG